MTIEERRAAFLKADSEWMAELIEAATLEHGPERALMFALARRSEILAKGRSIDPAAYGEAFARRQAALDALPKPVERFEPGVGYILPMGR